jgi:LPS-assembly lipoprotein
MPTVSAHRRLLIAAIALAPVLLSGCGFRLRGAQPLAFSTLYVGADPNSPLGVGLRRQIPTSGTTVIVEDPAAAEARLEILQDARVREILSLSGAGKVREYQIGHIITFRLVDRAGAELLPPTSISATRAYNFDDAQVIAKEQEEALLYRDMERDLQQQLMRRLAAVQR